MSRLRRVVTVIDLKKMPIDESQELDVGDVIWGRFSSYPWWPAVIVNRKEKEPDVELTDDDMPLPAESDTNRMVEFFNDDGRVAILELNNIREYTANMKLVRHSGKFRDDIIAACGEANNYILTEGKVTQQNLLSNLQSFDENMCPCINVSKRRPRSSKQSMGSGYENDDSSELLGRRKNTGLSHGDNQTKRPKTENLPIPRDNEVDNERESEKQKITDTHPGIENSAAENNHSRTVSYGDLAYRFEKFQSAVTQYHYDVLQAQYVRKLYESKTEKVRDSYRILSAETEKLKGLTVSRDTLSCTGVMEGLGHCTRTLEQHTPDLVERLYSLSNYWASRKVVDMDVTDVTESCVGKTRARGRLAKQNRINHDKRATSIPDTYDNEPEDDKTKSNKTELYVGSGRRYSVKDTVRLKGNESQKSIKEEINELSNMPLTDNMVPACAEVKAKKRKKYIRARGFEKKNIA